jgi:hypothetical protein
MTCYISSVAVVLTWSHDELRSHTADPLLHAAVRRLRARMKSHLINRTHFVATKEQACDTWSAIGVIDLAQVSVGGPHHLKVAVQSEIMHRASLLNR